jgi:hypothetical protein
MPRCPDHAEQQAGEPAPARATPGQPCGDQQHRNRAPARRQRTHPLHRQHAAKQSQRCRDCRGHGRSCQSLAPRSSWTGSSLARGTQRCGRKLRRAMLAKRRHARIRQPRLDACAGHVPFSHSDHLTGRDLPLPFVLSLSKDERKACAQDGCRGNALRQAQGERLWAGRHFRFVRAFGAETNSLFRSS